MADVGRKACDGAVEVVATAAVALGIDRSELPVSSGATAFDRTKRPGGVRKFLRQQRIQRRALVEISGQI